MIDLIVLGLVAWAAFRGWRTGLLGQVFELGGALIGLVIALKFAPQVAAAFTERPGLARSLIWLSTLLMLPVLGHGIGVALSVRVSSLIRRRRLGPLDSTLGSGFGAGATLVSFWLVAFLLVHGPIPALAKDVQRSRILTAMDRLMPQPSGLYTYVRDHLDTSGFPQVFAGFPRLISPPVKLPAEGQARKAVLAAEASTVRIVVPACGQVQLGSGWIAASDTVVTNAHVVAGGDDVTVQDENGDHSGKVILFNPRLDVAVIRVDGLTGQPLGLQAETLGRGTPGATLGYPAAEDGKLAWRRAAIQAEFEATGKDIYGDRDVRRDIYELRARVLAGDSGGPFVLPNGRVGGVVFAASTTDPGIGYALTGGEIKAELAKASRSSPAVATGGCRN